MNEVFNNLGKKNLFYELKKKNLIENIFLNIKIVKYLNLFFSFRCMDYFWKNVDWSKLKEIIVLEIKMMNEVLIFYV